jgi:hypothetical protein
VCSGCRASDQPSSSLRLGERGHPGQPPRTLLLPRESSSLPRLRRAFLAHQVFKAGRAWQPHAWMVRFHRRSVGGHERPKTLHCRGFSVFAAGVGAAEVPSGVFACGSRIAAVWDARTIARPSQVGQRLRWIASVAEASYRYAPWIGQREACSRALRQRGGTHRPPLPRVESGSLDRTASGALGLEPDSRTVGRRLLGGPRPPDPVVPVYRLQGDLGADSGAFAAGAVDG